MPRVILRRSALPLTSPSALSCRFTSPAEAGRAAGRCAAGSWRTAPAVFFIDPLAAQPHDVDVKALTRLAIVYDLPMACGPATADPVIASPLFAPVGPGTN
jgi:hypothetical protein